MSTDVIEILDEAVEVARTAGKDVAGWTLQSNEDGYAAWLYREDDEGQWPLFDNVDCQITALGAAQWVLRAISGGSDDD